MTTITPNNVANKDCGPPAKSVLVERPPAAEAKPKRTKSKAAGTPVDVEPITVRPRRVQLTKIEYLASGDGFRLTVDGDTLTLPPTTQLNAQLDRFGGDTEIMLSFSTREVEIIRRAERGGLRRARRPRAGKGGATK